MSARLKQRESVYWVMTRGGDGQLFDYGKGGARPGRMIGEDDLRRFREIKVMILQVLRSPLSPAEVGSQLG
jgi:hypothetical protein